MIRFFTYSAFHGKYEPVGSDYLRAYQLVKYWAEAEIYKYGENPEVFIFTKVFASQDYQFQKHFEGIKILDVCDPMHFENFNLVETAQMMDAVVTPTESLAEFIRQFHPRVAVIPDRFDMRLVPKHKEHTKKATNVVWFGYKHNAELLKPAMRVIDELDLNLILISDDDPFMSLWSKRQNKEFYFYKKYHEETIYQDLQSADFCILPEGNRPEDKFKSNNKTIKANLAGLPVAKTIEEVRLYLDPKQRQKWFKLNYDTIKSEYDIRKSVDDYKKLINEIKT